MLVNLEMAFFQMTGLGVCASCYSCVQVTTSSRNSKVGGGQVLAGCARWQCCWDRLGHRRPAGLTCQLQTVGLASGLGQVTLASQISPRPEKSAVG